MHSSPTSDEWINGLDHDSWRAWVRESWLPGNAQGLQGEALRQALEEVEAIEEESEAWKKSTLPERKAWI